MADNGATSTWSGYNHQGKVGLFVALREIARLKSSVGEIDVSTFGEWYIEFEGAEDFDICTKSPCSDLVYLHSRHQVKAYPGEKGRVISDYKEVLLGQSKTVANKGKNKGSYTKYRGFNKTIVDHSGNVIGELASENRYIHLVQNVQEWFDSGEDNTNEVHRYLYPSIDGAVELPYCDLSHSANEESDGPLPLDCMVHDIIKVITNKDETEAKLIWQSLQASLTTKIAECHDSKTSPRPKFTFQEIFDKFLQDNADLAKFVENYRADVLRRRLINEWSNIQSRYDERTDITSDERGRIDAWLCEVHKQNNAELKKYIDSFSPHRELTLQDIQLAGLAEVVCRAIRQVTMPPQVEVHEYRKNGIPYSLTTITDDANEYPDDILRREINETVDTKQDNPYRLCRIVTKNHDFDLLESQFTDQLEYDKDSIRVKSGVVAGVNVDNIKSYQSRRVISVANAVVELNRGNRD